MYLLAKFKSLVFWSVDKTLVLNYKNIVQFEMFNWI